jgi:poly(A) polymerase
VTDAVYTTGLVLIPPREAWPPIQAIRAEHDRKLRRWMPHVTLIYPFVPESEFDATAARLAPALAATAPFAVTLTGFDTFRHGRDAYTVWLRPEPDGALQALHAALWGATWAGAAGPRPPFRRFRPHLSVGQVRGRPAMLRLLESLRRTWQPLRFEAQCISLIRRDEPPDDIFRVAAELPLGGAEILD